MATQYGVILVLKDGTQRDAGRRWREWDDAAAFGESEVINGSANGFRVIHETED